MKKLLLLLWLTPFLSQAEDRIDFYGASLMSFKEAIGVNAFEQNEKEALLAIFPAGSSEDDSLQIVTKIIKANESSFWIERYEDGLRLGKSYKTPDGIFNWWICMNYEDGYLTSAEICGMAGGNYFTPEKLDSSDVNKQFQPGV